MSSACLFFAVWLALPAADVPAETPVEVVRIAGDEGTFDWAVQESTGRVFASCPAREEVVEYDPADGKALRRFRVEGAPGELLPKQDWLIVACRQARAVAVVDLAANQVAGTIRLEGRSPDALFCSRVDNTFAYARCAPGEDGSADEVFQVDLKSRTVRQRVTICTSSKTGGGLAHMSTDGKWVLVEARQDRNQPPRLELLSADEESGAFRASGASTFGSAAVSVVPGSRDWAIGGQIYPIGLSGLGTTFPGAGSVAVHPQFDLAACLRGERPPAAAAAKGETLTTYLRLSLASRSTTKETKAILLGPFDRGAPETGIRPQHPSSTAHDPRLQFDLPGNRLVCSWGRWADVVDLGKLGIAWQPSFRIDVPSVCRVPLGEEWRLKLALSNPDLLAQTRFTLTAGPEGAGVRDGHLVWRPSGADAGVHALEVSAVCGDRQDTCTVAVQVGLTEIPLGFVAAGLAVDRAGRHAVCWGSPTADPPPIGDQPRPGPTDYVVIDLQSAKVVRRERLDYGVSFIEVVEDDLFIGPAAVSLLYRAKLTGPGRIERLILPRAPRRVARLGKDRIAVELSEYGSGELRVYQRDTLQQVGSDPLNDGNAGSLVEVGDGLVRLLGQIVDPESGAVVCVLRNPPWPSLLGPRSESPQVVHGPWGRSLSPEGQLLARSSRMIWRSGLRSWKTREMAAEMSSVHPLLVAVQADVTPASQKLSLEVRDLETAALLRSIPLGEQRQSQGIPLDAPSHLKIVGSRVVMIQRDEVLVTDLGEDLVQRAPVPLHLKYPRVPVGDVAKPLTFRLTAAGGSGERKFALINDEEGLAVEGRTGDVTVDLPLLWKKYLAQLADRATSEAGHSGFVAHLLSLGSLQTNREAYQRLTSQPLPEHAMATTVPLGLAVTDDAGHHDRLDVYVVTSAPLKPIEEIAAQAKEVAAKRFQKLAADRPAGPPSATPMTAAQARGPAEAESVAELAKTLRRLEAALDAVIARLDALENRLKDQRPAP